MVGISEHADGLIELGPKVDLLLKSVIGPDSPPVLLREPGVGLGGKK